jgi:hypothetical protein
MLASGPLPIHIRQSWAEVIRISFVVPFASPWVSTGSESEQATQTRRASQEKGSHTEGRYLPVCMVFPSEPE